MFWKGRHAWACEAGGGPLPFPSKSTVDKQASPQTEEGRPALSAHLFNMGTFTSDGQRHTDRHVWVIRKSRDPAARRQLQLSPHRVSTSNVAVATQRWRLREETLLGTSRRPPPPTAHESKRMAVPHTLGRHVPTWHAHFTSSFQITRHVDRDIFCAEGTWETDFK